MLSYRKYLAAALAATMVVGSSTIAFAATTPSNFEMSGSDVLTTDKDDPNTATDTITGTGGVEGYVKEDVFKVQVPVLATDSEIFNFTLDPQGLIERTNADRYTADGLTFTDDTTMYFRNQIDKQNSKDFSNRSDYFELVNKSTMDVDASVKATVSNLGTGDNVIQLTDDKNFADDTSTSIYLALIDGARTPNEEPIMAEGAVMESGTIAASTTANLYVPTWDGATGKYNYDIDPVVAASATFNSFKFALTGASNSEGDWTNLTTAAPKVEVVWKVVPHVEKPTIATTTYPVTAGQDVVINVNLNGVATGITSITYKNSSGADATLAAENFTFDATNGTLTMKSAYTDALASRTRDFTIEFNDTAKTKIVVTVGGAPASP